MIHAITPGDPRIPDPTEPPMPDPMPDPIPDPDNPNPDPAPEPVPPVTRGAERIATVRFVYPEDPRHPDPGDQVPPAPDPDEEIIDDPIYDDEPEIIDEPDPVDPAV